MHTKMIVQYTGRNHIKRYTMQENGKDNTKRDREKKEDGRRAAQEGKYTPYSRRRRRRCLDFFVLSGGWRKKKTGRLSTIQLRYS
jgi:hypothetical protein